MPNHAAQKRPERFIVDIADATADLMRVNNALEQLQYDNQILSDALTESQGRLALVQTSREVAKSQAAMARLELTRMQATIDRRDSQVTDLEAELTKALNEHSDELAAMTAEYEESMELSRDRLIQAQDGLELLRTRLGELEDELAVERQRTAPDTHIVRLLTDENSVLVLDGESLANISWPELNRIERRPLVLEAVSRFQKRHGMAVEVIFGSTDGWAQEMSTWSDLRVRVPHEGIPIRACVDRLTLSYRSTKAASGIATTDDENAAGTTHPRVVAVSSEPAAEPWVSACRVAELMGMPIPPLPESRRSLVSAVGQVAAS